MSDAGLFPYPVENYIPKLNSDNPDDGYTALKTKLNETFLDWYNELVELYFIKEPSRCPFLLLDELSYMLNADVISSDTEAQKRKKIKNAVSGHLSWGQWSYIKTRIDLITGYSAAILDNQYDIPWFWTLPGSYDEFISWTAIEYAGNGIYVALGSRETDGNTFMARSVDNGYTWTVTDVDSDLPGTLRGQRLASNGSGTLVSVAIGDNDIIRVSTDYGATWTRSATADGFDPIDVGFGNSLFMVIGYHSTTNKNCWTSADGSSWTQNTYTEAPGYYPHAVRYGDGVWAVLGLDHYVYSSNSGGTWSAAVDLPNTATVEWRGFDSDGDGNWVAVGFSSTGLGYSHVATSSDITAGFTETLTPIQYAGMSNIAYGDGYFVIACVFDRIYTSNDAGAHITMRYSPQSDFFYLRDSYALSVSGSVTFANHTFFSTNTYSNPFSEYPKIMKTDIDAGIVINCHNGESTAVLSAGTISTLKEFLETVIPPYMRGYLGYIDADGITQVYTNGIIHET